MQKSVTELDVVFTYFVATQNEIGVAKDLLAAKPLSVMEDENAVALASEEVALRAVFPKEVESWDPYEGEVLVWTKPNA
jgi:glutamine phosphoribosylpyrophosphate amidotransferase